MICIYMPAGTNSWILFIDVVSAIDSLTGEIVREAKLSVWIAKSPWG
jgi:hypothetical protein